jgi:hypothetical protein
MKNEYLGLTRKETSVVSESKSYYLTPSKLACFLNPVTHGVRMLARQACPARLPQPNGMWEPTEIKQPVMRRACNCPLLAAIAPSRQ